MKDSLKSRKTLVVIGGGAAGIFCAVNAARMNAGLRVMVLEKTNQLLAKVRVSGGGRCNVTHDLRDRQEMSGRYPRGKNFVKKTFHNFFTTDTIQWFEERGVPLKTEADGRMFPVTDASQTIIDCLMRDINRYEVQVLLHATVQELSYDDGRFEIRLQDERRIRADFVCVACGGYPKRSQFSWLEKAGLEIQEPVPSLFTFNIPQHPMKDLMGISLPDVRVKIAGTKLEERGPLLITHWGLSGPVVLRLSAWGARELHDRQYQFSLRINWVPGQPEPELRERIRECRQSFAKQKISSKNPFGLPGRFWIYLISRAGILHDGRWADISASQLHQLIRHLQQDEYDVKGKTTFKEEFVTAGGVSLSEIEPHTMMSRKIPGLFFAGEILDVDGITGGFNFQHAWTSAYTAASAIVYLAEKDIS